MSSHITRNHNLYSATLLLGSLILESFQLDNPCSESSNQSYKVSFMYKWKVVQMVFLVITSSLQQQAKGIGPCSTSKEREKRDGQAVLEKQGTCSRHRTDASSTRALPLQFGHSPILLKEGSNMSRPEGEFARVEELNVFRLVMHCCLLLCMSFRCLLFIYFYFISTL